MKTKLTLFVTVLAAALFGVGCSSVNITKEQLQNGLIAYYPFSGNAMDGSGNGNHGEVKGATLVADRHGESNQAYSFDGDDEISASDKDYLNAMPISLSTWMKSNEIEQGYAGIVSKYQNASWIGYHLYLGKGNVGTQYLTGHYTQKGTGQIGGGSHNPSPNFTGIADGKWHQLVFTVNSTGGVLYVDGKGVDAKPWAGKPAPEKSRFPLTIGVLDDSRPAERSKMHFKGSIDDVRIYNRALSAAEVKALYDLEKPKGK